MDWDDLLSQEVRALEGKVSGFDPYLAERARALLRVIRGYETRVRQLALRTEPRTAKTLAAPPPFKPFG